MGGEILLVREAFVERYEHIVLCSGEFQQFAILLSRLSALRDGPACVSAQMPANESGKVLVKKNPHRARFMRKPFASSSAAIAISRDTEGKLSKKTSRESPPSK